MRRDEEGSLIIAVGVILVLSGLSLAVLARTISALASARLSQDSAAATTAAGTGVTDALYVLDHTDIAGPVAITKSGASFTWTATLDTASTGIVSSTGTVNGHSHTVQAKVTRGASWPWLVATAGSLVIDGPATIASSPPLGAGGQMVLRDGAVGGAEEDLLGPGASCSGCSPSPPNPVVLPATQSFADPVVPSPAPSAPPGGCSGISTLPTGTYLCQGVVTFAHPAPVTIGPGPVELYITASGPIPPTLDFSQASVNSGGSAADLVVHIVGPGIVQPGDDSQAGSYTGVIDGPRASLRSNPCQFTLTGAAVLGSLDCVSGATGPTLGTDGSTSTVYAQDWQASSYQDTAS